MMQRGPMKIEEGIQIGDTIASSDKQKLRFFYPNITLFYGNLVQTLFAIIQTGTWLWKTQEENPVFELLYEYLLHEKHI